MMTATVERLGLGLRVALAAVVGLAVTALPVKAQTTWEPRGTKAIVATMADNTRIQLGTVHFNAEGDGPISFKIDWHSQPGGPFQDYFLSMREFKCIEGATELSCQVPYPHATPRTVSRQASPTQWAWLEHSLMFFYKRPADFGAKLWNGVYYELRATPTGLQGKPQAIDLNLIAAPPAQTAVAPYKATLRDEMPAQARWLRSLSVE